jgi:hypothetical protein
MDNFIFNDNGDFFKVSQKNGLLKINLKLQSEKTQRLIGTVKIEDKTLILKRKKAKHLFRKNNSYGFNEYLIQNGQTFDKIMLADDDAVYLFPKSLVVEKGNYLYFKQEGFEKQIFLPLDELKEYQIFPLPQSHETV